MGDRDMSSIGHFSLGFGHPAMAGLVIEGQRL
jgi:hypothetical protein